MAKKARRAIISNDEEDEPMQVVSTISETSCFNPRETLQAIDRVYTKKKQRQIDLEAKFEPNLSDSSSSSMNSSNHTAQEEYNTNSLINELEDSGYRQSLQTTTNTAVAKPLMYENLQKRNSTLNNWYNHHTYILSEEDLQNSMHCISSQHSREHGMAVDFPSEMELCFQNLHKRLHF